MLYRGERPVSRGTRVYVGGLVGEVTKEDLEAEFEKFGKLNSVWVAFNPPGFAFVEFSNQEDAEAACDTMNNTELLGSKLRVEISRARGRGGRGGGRGMDRGGRGGGSRDDGGFRGGYRGRGGFGSRGGFGGGFDRDGDKGGYRGGRGGRGGSRFDDFEERDFGGRESGFGGGGGRDGGFSGGRGREGGFSSGRGRDNGFGEGRNSFGGGGGRNFDSSREFGGRTSRGGFGGSARGGGGFSGRGGRPSGGDYGSDEYNGGFGGPRNTSRFRSRSPVGRGSRQAY